MNRVKNWTTRTLEFVGISLGILAITAACTGSTGSEGNLKFKDESGISTRDVIPIAEGRSSNYTVTNNAFQPKNKTLDTVTSSDESVLDVTGVNGSSFTVKALKQGTSTIDVVTEDGVTDSIDLEVRNLGDAYLKVVEFDNADKDIDKKEGANVPKVMSAQRKYNLEQGDRFALSGVYLVDSEGERLSGSGDLLSHDQQTGTMTIQSSSTSLDVQAGAVGDTASSDTVDGEAIRFRTVADYEPVGIQAIVFPTISYDLYIKGAIRTGKSLDITNVVGLLQLIPEDADGYGYVGSTDLKASAKLVGSDNIALSYRGRGNGDCIDQVGSECVEWENLSELVFLINSAKPGDDASLTITTGGVTEKFILTVSDEVEADTTHDETTDDENDG